MAAERTQAIERITDVEGRVLSMEGQLGGLAAQVMTLQETTAGLGEQLQDIATKMTSYTNGLEAEKVRFANELNQEFDGHKRALAQVVTDARSEFDGLKSTLAGLYGHTAQAFASVKEKVEQLEYEILQQKGAGGIKGASGATSGFIPIKSMVPPAFNGADEQWRSWQEDIADYLDAQKPGIKKVLNAAEKEIAPIDDTWVRDKGLMYSVDADGQRANVHRALKALTTGEAKLVVQGIRDENGYLAWRALHQRFGPSVAARQGKVMCDLSQMVTKPAKSPSETRTLVTELERRIRVAEDITGDTVGDSHLKSILASILDPTTRAHTSAYQGVSTGYQELKRAVLEFANNTIATHKPDTSDPMNIGKCVEQPTWEQEANSEETWDVVDDQLAAVSFHTQCFQCGGYGHLAHTCSTPKGKGKGFKGGPKGGKGDAPKGGPKGGAKGSPKGSPKGGQKRGPANGCWTCGGQHFASECPHGNASSGGGKGKGGKGFNSMEHHWPQPSVKPLCSLRVANRYEALSEEEEEPAKTTLADFMPALQQPQTQEQPQKQGQPKQPRTRGQTKVQTAGRLSPLTTIEPEGLSPVTTTPQWELLEIAVDSGASETVIPEGAVGSTALQQSEASKRGVQYEVANGHRIANLGQKTFQGITEFEGLARGITAQVCDVNKPLLSVAKLVKAGNTVVFSAEGSYVEDDATRERIWLQESGGMFMLKLWVPDGGVF